MTVSTLAKRNHCVTRIGSTASNPEAVVNDVVAAFANELNFGTYTINNADSLSNNSQQGAVFKPISTTELLIQQHGETAFYESVSTFNTYFENTEIKKLIADIERYPNITKRINQNLIFTPIEVAEFTNTYQYIPITLKDQANTITPKLLNEVEDFYGNGISGGILDSFCLLIPVAFAAVGFFDALNNMQNFVNVTKNFSLEDLSLKLLIDKIKDQIISVVERVVDNVKNIIENFSIENIIKEAATYFQQNVILRFYDIKEKALNFFSPSNIESFKNKIKGIIEYALNLFKNPSLDEIQFLIYRFCNFGAQIEKGIKGLIDPLTDYTSSYQSSLNALKSSSNVNTERAIRAGAIRVLPEQRSAVVSAANGNTSALEPFGGTGADITPTPITQVETGDISPLSAEELNSVTKYNEGKGDSRVTFVDGTLKPAITKEGKKPPAWRWESQSLKSRAKVMRIQARFGKQLKIVSARRTYQEQKALYNSIKDKTKVAKPGNSRHEQGHAYDIKWDGYPSGRKEFLKIAVQEGMVGIGGYSSFVHIDEGHARLWGNTEGVNPKDPKTWRE